jgi:hypothetical protein
VRRRKLLLGSLVAALVALAVLAGSGVFVPRPGPNRLTLQNCQRIREGMSRAEVEAILGPPGDYRTGPTDIDGKVVPLKLVWVGEILPSDGDIAYWSADEVYERVMFDPAGRVREGGFSPTFRPTQSPSDNLLWRLRRQWRRWFP